jgi:hypothetical protein
MPDDLGPRPVRAVDGVRTSSEGQKVTGGPSPHVENIFNPLMPHEPTK